MKKKNLKSLRLKKQVISKINHQNILGGIPGKPPAQPIARKTKFTECRVICPSHPRVCP
ncbi:hypothetical protein [Kordia sp.]|uniref:hypothetical protein n=1 Tax=Kordia sp. TaxID=1965332 RepID=UPI003D6B189D